MQVRRFVFYYSQRAGSSCKNKTHYQRYASFAGR